MRTFKRVEPAPGTECLCGSTLPFRNCCMVEYSDGNLGRAKEAVGKGRLSEALFLYRRHLTWYRLAHLAHTAPYASARPHQARYFVDVDIDALSDLIGAILNINIELGDKNEALLFIKKMERIVDFPRWKWKISFWRAYWFLACSEDKASAIRELGGKECLRSKDVDVIKLYVDLNAPVISDSEIVNAIRLLLPLLGRPFDILHYRGLDATKRYLTGDAKSGAQIFSATFAEFDRTRLEKSNQPERNHYARILIGAFQLTSSRSYLTKAISLLKQIESEGAPQSQLHELYSDIAYALQLDGNFSESLQYFLKCTEIQVTDTVRIFHARSLLAMGDPHGALAMLDEIDANGLESALIYDLGASYAFVALETKSPECAKKAIGALSKGGHLGPYFDKIRLDLISDVNGISYESKMKTIISIIADHSKYIEIKPKLFGISINVSKIIQDLAEKLSKK